MTILTDFGDLAVVLPLAAALLLWLLTLRPRSSAAWWASALAICAGVTAVLKVYFLRAQLAGRGIFVGRSSIDRFLKALRCNAVGIVSCACWICA